MPGTNLPQRIFLAERKKDLKKKKAPSILSETRSFCFFEVFPLFTAEKEKLLAPA